MQCADSCSFLDNPQLRDPLTIALGFMTHVNEFRQCSRFTVEVFNQAVYLEVFVPCSFARLMPPAPRLIPTSSQEKAREHDPDDDGGGAKYVPVFLKQTTLFSNSGVNARQWSGLTLQHMPKLSLLPANFCMTAVLAHIVVQNLPQLESVSRRCLFRCRTLTYVIFRRLPELRLIEDCMLCECPKLESVVFEELPSLTTISQHFLINCKSLTSATFRELPKLERLGLHGTMCEGRVLSENFSLRSVCFEDLPELREVGAMWLASCPSLTDAVFKNLPELTRVEMWWLNHCPNLLSLTMENLVKLKTVGKDWLGSSGRLNQVHLKGVPQSIFERNFGPCPIKLINSEFDVKGLGREDDGGLSTSTD